MRSITHIVFTTLTIGLALSANGASTLGAVLGALAVASAFITLAKILGVEAL